MKNILNIPVTQTTPGIIFTDIAAIMIVIFLPAISHMMPFPLFYLDPMRLVLLGVYFVTRNEKNAYIIAMGLPIFSMLYSGHPVFYKAILISFVFSIFFTFSLGSSFSSSNSTILLSLIF